MYKFFFELLEPSLGDKLLTFVPACLTILAAAVIAFVAKILIESILKSVAKKFKKKGRVWAASVLEHKLPSHLACLVIPTIIGDSASSIPNWPVFLNKLITLLSAAIILMIVNAFIHIINDTYSQLEISKTKPIRSFLQVAKIFVYIIIGVFALSVLIDQNPAVLLGSIGAAAAVISFVFKDPILNFVSGLQLTSNDMVRIGDNIEMPKHAVAGSVEEITITSIKVRNADKTVTSIPAQVLMNDAFINWRGMAETGVRRIKRALYIDAMTIQLCDDEMIRKFSDIHLLHGYMENKTSDIALQNIEEGKDNINENPVNIRHLTNIGTFRAYMEAYLRQLPAIDQNLTITVQQLPAADNGIPLEICAFTGITDGIESASLQSDIFDHFYSVAPQFGLGIYQQPTGTDIRFTASK